MAIARSLCMRPTVMLFGEIAEENTSLEFFHNPRHERTRLFLSQIL
jgi:ABC-type polar amino acid transport system ATPase subunit